MPVLPPDVLAALLAPIPGDAPGGRDLRYDPRYDAIREARREDADLPQGAFVAERKLADWPRVQKDTTALLTTGSKDLQLAAWLTEALLKRHGLGGLGDGLTVLTGLLQDYWDVCFPELEDGDVELRLGPVEWVGAKLDVAVRQVAVAGEGLTWIQWQDAQTIPTEAEAKADREKREFREARVAEGKRPRDVAEKLVEQTPKAFYKALVADAAAVLGAIATLDRVADERFADDPPSLVPLRTAVEAVQQVASQMLAEKLRLDPDPPEPEPEVAAEAAADAAGGARSATGAPAVTMAAEPA
ncbi:type VI secretion system protein TssA, partial [Roseisolibacter sp. H3M3-2]|uniref:type VI secretion system protein TssA n=1 Tax=Roseisolibacter sp. H3M3-2 TaxID=3031323 RepID=UPI0023DC02F9